MHVFVESSLITEAKNSKNDLQKMRYKFERDTRAWLVAVQVKMKTKTGAKNSARSYSPRKPVVLLVNHGSVS